MNTGDLEENNEVGTKVSESNLVYKPDLSGKRYTYADYCSWDDDQRWELIRGEPIKMDAPNRRHQKISGNLFAQLYNFLKGKPCQVYAAAFDVRLNPDDGDDTVVQPDLVVVCNRSILDDAGCRGVPDMVVEILSSSTAKYDLVRKFKLYQEVGIREYWVVDPERSTLAAHVLHPDGYVTKAYGEEYIAPVDVLEGCEINLKEVFEDD